MPKKMNTPPRKESVLNHYQKFFEGHETKVFSFDKGPISKVVPDFKVFCAAPGPKIDIWSYCSIGASQLWHNDSGLVEFVIHSQEEHQKLIELTAMLTYYHADHNLGVGHTLPIGQPWLKESICNYFLISLPYPLGPEFEICNLDSTHIHILWALPISENEINYKVKNGLEALEQKFDDHAIEFWNEARESII